VFGRLDACRHAAIEPMLDFDQPLHCCVDTILLDRICR
jgi:hypothetical protein